eukprot:gene36998-44888_t
MIFLVLLFFFIASILTSRSLSDDEAYGVDVSFPIHHNIDSIKYPHFAAAYEDHIQGCYRDASEQECNDRERERMGMNFNQPSQQHNYTEVGFKKITLPKSAWDPLLQFYKANIENAAPEKWPKGNTYVNHWLSVPSMISLWDPALNGSVEVKQLVSDTVKRIVEEWVGREVEPTSLYGIRVYKNQSILATHVDRLPLVSSAIIQVAQDVDEPWPIEVYDHSGRAHNITMQPGDLVLYESHTLLHGRPFPMKGRFYANVFVHFKPLDHDQMNQADADLRLAAANAQQVEDKNAGVHEQSHVNPEEVGEDAKEEDNLSAAGDELMQAVSDGDLSTVKYLLLAQPELLSFSDENNWTVLHEAIRSGSEPMVRFLLEQGADVRAKVSEGVDALELADTLLPSDHPVVELLKEHLELTEQ